MNTELLDELKRRRINLDLPVAESFDMYSDEMLSCFRYEAIEFLHSVESEFVRRQAHAALRRDECTL